MKKTQRSFNSTIRKSGPPKKTNPARRRKNHLRAYGPPGYVEWIHEQPCVACGFTPSECAHVGRNSGMGRKGDWTETVPLCGPHNVGFAGIGPRSAGCHRHSHVYGRETFEKVWRIDLNAKAVEIQELFRASLGSSPGGQT